MVSAALGLDKSILSRTSAASIAERKMVADAERLGLYDMDPAEVKAALKAARPRSEAD